MILRSIFSHQGQLNDLYAAITEYLNTHWCSRRKKTFLNRMKMCIFLVLHKYQIFSFSTALQKLQKIVTCFPEDKLSYIYPDLQIQKVFIIKILQGVCKLLTSAVFIIFKLYNNLKSVNFAIQCIIAIVRRKAYDRINGIFNHYSWFKYSFKNSCLWVFPKKKQKKNWHQKSKMRIKSVQNIY